MCVGVWETPRDRERRGGRGKRRGSVETIVHVDTVQCEEKSQWQANVRAVQRLNTVTGIIKRGYRADYFIVPVLSFFPFKHTHNIFHNESIKLKVEFHSNHFKCIL